MTWTPNRRGGVNSTARTWHGRCSLFRLLRVRLPSSLESPSLDLFLQEWQVYAMVTTKSTVSDSSNGTMKSCGRVVTALPQLSVLRWSYGRPLVQFQFVLASGPGALDFNGTKAADGRCTIIR